MVKFLILPCNKYAREGDYLKSKAWQNAKKLFPNYKLAAVDSIITIKDPKGDRETLGAIVLYPEEMYRVRGFDEYPSWDKFKRLNFKLLWEHTKYVEIGLRRISYRAERMIIILNVRAYKLAVYLAIRRIYNAIPNNVLFIDVPERPWGLQKGINLAKRIENNEGGRIYRLRWRYEKGFPEDVPCDFKYWEKEKIIWIDHF